MTFESEMFFEAAVIAAERQRRRAPADPSSRYLEGELHVIPRQVWVGWNRMALCPNCKRAIQMVAGPGKVQTCRRCGDGIIFEP